MIESLEINNFQSHKKTKLHFVDGVNVITGPSDNGKTSVIRSMLWAIKNKPDGMGFVSHWNLNEKKNIKEETSVKIGYDGGKELVRYRGKDSNGYRLGDTVLEAIGRGEAPESVQVEMDMTEVNIQEQLDSHFLLADSAGEVARIFNKTIRLDSIDKILSVAEQKKRAIKSSLTLLTEQKNKVEKEIEQLAWIDGVDGLLERAQSNYKRVDELEKEKVVVSELLDKYSIEIEKIKKLEFIPDIEKMISEYEEYDEKNAKMDSSLSSLNNTFNEHSKQLQFLNRYKKIDEVSKNVEELLEINKENELKKEEKRKLRDLGIGFTETNETLSEYPDIKAVDEYIDKLALLYSDVSRKSNEKGEITELENEYHVNFKKLKDIEKEIKGLEESLPEVCPMCNGTGKVRI